MPAKYKSSPKTIVSGQTNNWLLNYAVQHKLIH